ncbi:hypothetical protein GGQ97_000765 [Sphingomonas kaistensis]|uniref:Putative auto-transporter adhesin head GIN domain-containing protein n=1 Tax=Sphingomonas kaistensis TaxID=298708 RepID=A0A7X6BGF5_9SPHN|nr:head GIN domain-containing protein [Sphingomonas kaistensis]NJC04972.1 hypothetical protein [Sphingomonas kaistensis]
MTRILAFLLLAAAAVPAAAAERRFTIISFDRIRMEAPFDVVLTTGKPPSAVAEGPVAALDSVDLRVEGRTLIVRQRSGWNGEGKGVPVRIRLGTPDLRAATLMGSGRLQIDRMTGLAATLGLAGPGQLMVADLRADRLDLLAGGSGTVALAGAVKNGRIGTEGTVVLDASALQSEELTLVATGSSELRAAARRTVNLTASGAATVTLQSPVACIQKVTGAATVSGCR